MKSLKVLTLVLLLPGLTLTASKAGRNNEATGILKVNPTTGEWSFIADIVSGWGLIQNAPVVVLTGGKIVSTREIKLVRKEKDFKGVPNAWRLTWRDSNDGIEVSQILSPREDQDALMVETEVRNIGGSPIAVQEVRAVNVGNSPDSSLAIKGQWRKCGFYQEANSSIWAGVKRLDVFDDPIKIKPDVWIGRVDPNPVEVGQHISWGGVNVVNDPESQVAFCCSALSWKRTVTRIRMEIGKDGPKSYVAASEFAGFSVKPGSVIQTEPLWLAFGRDPLRLLERYADAAGAYSHARIWPNSPMGFMTWYAVGTKGGADAVLRNADFVHRHFAGYPFEYIHWGHGWQWKSSLGNWIADEQKNPKGLKWLSDELAKRKMKLGLFCAFLVATEDSPVFQEHPDWFLREAETGKLAGTEFGIWEGERWKRWAYFLDGTNPGARQFLRDTVRRLKKDGCKFWLFDFGGPYSSSNIYYDKSKVPGQECLRSTYDLMLKELDQDDFVYLCSSQTVSFVGQAHCVICTSDIGGPGSNYGSDFLTNLSSIGARWYGHRRFWITQPDALVVGLPGTVGKARVRASLVALCGGPVFLSEDLPAVPEERLALAETVMPPYGQAARPIDLFSHPYPDGYPRIWSLAVKTDWDQWLVVGLLNAQNEEVNLKLRFEELGLDPDKQYRVREFWTGEDLGDQRAGLSMKVPANDARVLSIRIPRPYPWIEGTDMHITQGGVEIQRAFWNKQQATLSLKLKRRAGAKGKIYVRVPDGFTTSEGPIEKGILAVSVDFPKPTITREVKFNRN